MSNYDVAGTVREQLDAMGCERYHILVLPQRGHERAETREWDQETLLRSLPYLRHKNANRCTINIAPAADSDLTLVDDLPLIRLDAIKGSGFNPALVIETSAGNTQAWFRHEEVLGRDLNRVAAKELASRIGGDPGAAAGIHHGLLAGFTNCKTKHINVLTSQYPFAKIVEASAAVYAQAGPFVADMKRELDRQKREFLSQRPQYLNAPLKTIDDFRGDPRYGGDGHVIDCAYALYAHRHGVADAEIKTAIRSRDLSKKGTIARQSGYVARTLEKAKKVGMALWRAGDSGGQDGNFVGDSTNLLRWLNFTNFESCSAASVLWSGDAC